MREPTPDERAQLTARGIRVVDGEVAELEVSDGRLRGVRMASGEVVPRQALAVAPVFTARADVLVSLGLQTAEMEVHGAVVGSYVPSDFMGATAVPGVWIAGNVANLQAQVIAAAGAGLNAGAAINADLIAEDTRDAVAAARSLAGAR